MTLSLVSSAFRDGTDIPSRYTCDGQDASPPLSWSGVPPDAKSLALIVDDPDAPDPAAPQRTWVHWVLYNLPAQSDGLAEAVTPGDLPKGTKQAMNDWHRTGYGGPCPPVGRHRYFSSCTRSMSKFPSSLKRISNILKKPCKAMLLLMLS